MLQMYLKKVVVVVETMKDLIVVIPAYEPPQEFVDYAKTVSKIAKQLIVVNDGSNENYNKIFAEISEIKNAVYLTYPENHGKGYALKTAFKYCIDKSSSGFSSVQNGSSSKVSGGAISSPL